ncbi:MAG TPA: tRNA (adenosine(37)-N6)-threonylcarbamoyltransferase complex ATPase subunit type 1 TsaE [Gemmatimonadales bacterium]|jgi:tRNA threonylcarbamoyladenosine biosynthesis protein TsaE|nr:tRNA (adenosine(37)-N6)-threonylcarbamoyltransferase complex ATPase subunit type 1 TsaE [Gemmatimonadales bacterium]
MTTLTLSESQLLQQGEAIGRGLAPRSVVFFVGELGAGKTTLVQAISRGLGVTRHATSPTYNLVHRYQGTRGPVFHLDCYRLKHPDEAADLDWESLLKDGDAVLIEWPERAGAYLPTPSLTCTLAHVESDPARRRLEIG